MKIVHRLYLTDFFKVLEDDLVEDGALSLENRAWICSILRRLPLVISQEELRDLVFANQGWLASQLAEHGGLDAAAAREK